MAHLPTTAEGKWGLSAKRKTLLNQEEIGHGNWLGIQSTPLIIPCPD